MATTFFNIKNAVSSNNEVISFFNQFLATAPLASTSSVYAACVLAIGACMYAAGCRNLIYKVLNLAVLSVFVVALWAYLTDVTFIYVVYILTFVSAVVMLFLSVVLMLPSSAISISTKNFNVLLAAATEPVLTDTLFSLLVYLAFFVFVYLGFAAFRTRIYANNTSLFGEPRQPVKLVYTSMPVSTQVKSLETMYTLKTFSSLEANKQAVESCLSYSIDGAQVSPGSYTTGDHQARVYSDVDLARYIAGVSTAAYPAYIRVYPRYFFKSYKSLQDYRIVRSLLTVAYEFTDFYFRVLEPTSLLRDSKLYTRATRSLKIFVGIVGANRPLPALWYDENGWRTQCRFDTVNKNLVIFVFDRPWWSPFQVFRTPSNRPIFASSVQLIIGKLTYYANAVKETAFIKSSVIAASNYCLFSTLQLLKKINNRLGSFTLRFSGNSLELAAQIAGSLSLFLLAAPAGYPSSANNNYSFHAASESFPESLENLAAIQHHLYVVSPMLMIVSVTGLLVALVGAPLFVSPGHATKKVPHKH